MKIGFDAKRFFHNSTGLGNYSRTLVNGLLRYYPGHEYVLFNPKPSRRFPKPEGAVEVLPSGLGRFFPSAWRSGLVTRDLERLKIDLYHGLSHEIPRGINRRFTRSVVTIHDLIFERYPQQFGRFNTMIYRSKWKYACKKADHIIAISEQTKKDLVDFYQTDPARITVCYQSCSPVFAQQLTSAEREAVRVRLRLPERYFLYVGSIIERKNLLGICQAYSRVHAQLNIPLVVIGTGAAYKQKVVSFIRANKLEKQIRFLSDEAGSDPLFRSGADFPAIYQMAEALIYPSFFEGFGIPILEALSSRTPVITSNRSCLPETAGPAALYVDPSSVDGLAEAMLRIADDQPLRVSLVEKGERQAGLFTPETCTASVMDVYKSVLR